MNKEQQFNDLYAKNKDKIYRICCYYMDDPDDRQDLFQEVLTNIWRGLDRFEGRSKVSTWVFRIAVNSALAHRKKQRRENSSMNLAENEFADGYVHDSTEGEQESIRQLHRAISGLNKIERAIISLMLEDVSQKEIAEIMGFTENNIRVKIHRIKGKLKTLLNPQSHGN